VKAGSQGQETSKFLENQGRHRARRWGEWEVEKLMGVYGYRARNWLWGGKGRGSQRRIGLGRTIRGPNRWSAVIVEL